MSSGVVDIALGCSTHSFPQELDENSKEIFLESMERKKPQDQWTEDEWETVVDVAGGGTLEFDKMPPGVLVKK